MTSETIDAVAGALRFARRLCDDYGQQPPPVSAADIERAQPAARIDLSEFDLRLPQAQIVEAELLRLSDDLATFFRPARAYLRRSGRDRGAERASRSGDVKA
jgi:hypothetical protein